MASVVELQQAALFRENVSRRNAVDACIASRIRYTGPQASWTVQVAANGDITLRHGVAAAEIADVSVGLPTLNGIIDVSDATALTFHLVKVHLNASANWEWIHVDALPDHSPNGIGTDAGDGALLLRAETTGPTGGFADDGMPLFLDTGELIFNEATDLFGMFVSIGHENLIDTELSFDERRSDPEGDYQTRKRNTQNAAIANVTTGDNANNWRVYEVDDLAGTSLLIHSESGANSAVESTMDLNAVADWIRVLPIGKRLGVVYTSEAAPTAGFITAQGWSERLGFRGR